MGPSAPQPVVLQPEGEGAALGTEPPPVGSDAISREPESDRVRSGGRSARVPGELSYLLGRSENKTSTDPPGRRVAWTLGDTCVASGSRAEPHCRSWMRSRDAAGGGLPGVTQQVTQSPLSRPSRRVQGTGVGGASDPVRRSSSRSARAWALAPACDCGRVCLRG